MDECEDASSAVEDPSGRDFRSIPDPGLSLLLEFLTQLSKLIARRRRQSYMGAQYLVTTLPGRDATGEVGGSRHQASNPWNVDRPVNITDKRWHLVTMTYLSLLATQSSL